MVVQAACPVIISASRSTDIPAFYADWFFLRLEKGYIRWINSFSPNLPYYVSFEKTRAVVFWSKNPAPIIRDISLLNIRGLSYYFQYTLNDYEAEGLEPGLPPLSERIDTFIRLSKKIGKERVIWRFDPVLLTPTVDISEILNRIRYIGNCVSPFTKKLVFSFVELKYTRVKRSARVFHFRGLTKEEKQEFICGLIRLNQEWDLNLAVCADETEYSPHIMHNKCIDDLLLAEIGRDDPELVLYLKSAGKDHGQRPACQCIRSKDIGQYDTCLHGCMYCYATDHEKAEKNYQKHSIMPGSDTITGDKLKDNEPVIKDIRMFFDI